MITIEEKNIARLNVHFFYKKIFSYYMNMLRGPPTLELVGNFREACK